MRIASSQYHATMNSALQAANSGLAHVMQQMSSGQRVLKPSDDTIATVRMARLSREEAALDQYRENIGALRTRLQTNEVIFDGMTNDLKEVRDLLVWAADGANTPKDVAAMATSLESLRDSLFFAANTRNAEGKFLFSGTATNANTVVDTGAAPPLRYQQPAAVNGATQDVAVGDGVTLAANVSLGALSFADFLNKLDETTKLLKDGTYTGSTARDQLGEVDKMLDGISGQISILGGRQKVLQTLEDNHASVSLANQQAALELSQLDYGEASVRLSSYTLAVQATQKAYAKVSQLSLFNAF